MWFTFKTLTVLLIEEISKIYLHLNLLFIIELLLKYKFASIIIYIIN